MSFLEPNTLQLLSRNEGKIKSYESCFDIRAWSHDVFTRDRHLKEWIRCDMPKAVVPISTVLHILRTMSCRHLGRVTPRCHVDCKSKVVLDSICSSCHAMKNCLRGDDQFQKYFVEEELETSNWPCERCLEALKGIKMFWRILIDKLFNINISRNVFKDDSCCPTTSVRDVAKIWQNDLVQQACVVKSIADKQSIKSYGSLKPDCRGNCKSRDSRIHKICSEGDRESALSHNECKCKKTNCQPSKCESIRNRSNRYTSVRVKTCDACCSTMSMSNSDELGVTTNLETHKRCLDSKCEMKKLRNENTALKVELENMRNSCKWKSPMCRSKPNAIADMPKSFECCIEENESCPGSIKPTESEMVITLKNCQNPNFKHVSLLQVLHKTNEPLPDETGLEGPCHKEEDPVALLNKVQSTLGAIFRREKYISAERRAQSAGSKIEATYSNLNPCKSLSCSTCSLTP